MILGRYYNENVILEANHGIAYDVSEEKETGKLIVKARRVATTSDMYSERYKNPPIPSGYKYKKGSWYNGFSIQRKSDKSTFTWIPVGWLDFTGTLDGCHFCERFGRRNFRFNEFSENEYSEPITDELEEQIRSILKYGGFYISSYLISKEDGIVHSVKKAEPLTNISIDEAKKLAKGFENNNDQVSSHLPYGAEYDSILEWFIKNGKRSVCEIVEDSTGWCAEGIYETGKKHVDCTCNIWDLAGNLAELTQEKYRNAYGVIRGGQRNFAGPGKSVAHRCFNVTDKKMPAGMRIALTIK